MCLLICFSSMIFYNNTFFLSASSGHLAGEGGDIVVTTAQPNLSSIEIEATIREQVKNKFDNLKQAFKMYDVDENETVTKGEFRRVLESFCLPLTTEQFDGVMAKVRCKSNDPLC